MKQLKNEYDLEERTTRFSSELIIFCKLLHKDVITLPIINQLIRCGTSVGANYREANGASSKKEAKETLYWLELIGKAIDNEKQKQNCRKLWKEAKELTLIFSKIAYSTKN